MPRRVMGCSNDASGGCMRQPRMVAVVRSFSTKTKLAVVIFGLLIGRAAAAQSPDGGSAPELELSSTSDAGTGEATRSQPVQPPAESAAATTPDATDGGTPPLSGSTPADSVEVIDPVLLELKRLLETPIVTASQIEEPTSETPVPVTLITAEMIRASGARNLQDVLIAYVPGMTFVVDHNEMNVAMRGVYASSQQKILVLVDGHRLNSRAYSMANPDFSISLDKVKQIEVLRGPGSSLYGNVALTAVVNLVTRPGGEVSGVWVKGGIGDYGQQTASLLAGTDFGARGEVLLWGSFYKSDGQVVDVPPEKDYSAAPQGGRTVIYGVRDPASYDVGLKYRFGGLSLIASRRYGKIIEPFTAAGAVTGEVYDYGSYRTLRTIGPGLGSESTHLGLKHVHALTDRLEIEVNGYYDTNEIGGVTTSNQTGGAVFLSWVDDDLGAVAVARYRYDLGSLGSGSLMAGGQFERMRLLDSMLVAAANYDWVRFADSRDARVLELGRELLYSGFAQVKHRLTPSILLNVGARYDEKVRHEGPNVRDLSPRAAVIYLGPGGLALLR